VGEIHNANRFFTGSINELEEKVRQWFRGEIDDDKYLSAVRSAYEASARDWGWSDLGTVWGGFAIVCAELKLKLEQAATTNLAKCYWPPGDPDFIQGDKEDKISGNDLAMRCAEQYPLQELIEALDPKAVFIAKANDDSRKLFGGLETDPERCRI